MKYRFYRLICKSHDEELYPNAFVYDTEDKSIEYLTRKEYIEACELYNISTRIDKFSGKFTSALALSGNHYKLFSNELLNVYIEYVEGNSYITMFLELTHKRMTYVVNSPSNAKVLPFSWITVNWNKYYTIISETYAEYLVSDKNVCSREIGKILGDTNFCWKDNNGLDHTCKGLSFMDKFYDDPVSYVPIACEKGGGTPNIFVYDKSDNSVYFKTHYDYFRVVPQSNFRYRKVDYDKSFLRKFEGIDSELLNQNGVRIFLQKHPDMWVLYLQLTGSRFLDYYVECAPLKTIFRWTCEYECILYYAVIPELYVEHLLKYNDFRSKELNRILSKTYVKLKDNLGRSKNGKISIADLVG